MDTQVSILSREMVEKFFGGTAIKNISELIDRESNNLHTSYNPDVPNESNFRTSNNPDVPNI